MPLCRKCRDCRKGHPSNLEIERSHSMAARKSKAQAEQSNELKVSKREDEKTSVATARAILGPNFRHGMAVSRVMASHLGEADFAPGLGDYADAIGEFGDKAEKGDLAFASRMLAAQALTLDNIFAEMARRMALNMGEYLGATETYARIALKAQANSRTTLEALAKLHQPREQTVRHVHVNEGGQAVIADEFHHHAGGQRIAGSFGQPQAIEGGASVADPALPCPDPIGEAVPVPGGEGKPAVQNARRQGKRRAEGQ